MKTMDLVNTLRRENDGHCLGCPHASRCSVTRLRQHTKRAANELERLLTIAADPDSVSSAEKQACFRLGQKDMKQSIMLLLQDLASNTVGTTRDTLTDAANMIEDLPIEDDDP